MSDIESNKPSWLEPLVLSVRQAVARKLATTADRRPALQHERDELAEQCNGWMQSLSKKISPELRAQLEAVYQVALDRQQEIDAQLLDVEMQQRRVDLLFDEQAVMGRLDILDRIMAEKNPTLGNLQLAMHIDRIDVFPDGRVVMRMCKVGLLEEAVELLSDCEVDNSSRQDVPKQKVTPRRRARLRTEGADEDGDDLRNAAFFAADPNRFAGLGDEWFWVDEFRVPEQKNFAVDRAGEVFQRRQETRYSYAKLAGEFGVSRPLIAAAIRHFEQTHPGVKDAVQLQAGGKRPIKYDVSTFADEARELWIGGWSKEKLAKKYACCAQIVTKAIEFSFERAGLTMPTRQEARLARVTEARRHLDVGESLEQIATLMKVSDVTARDYLRESFAAEGKVMPDLRCRKPA